MQTIEQKCPQCGHDLFHTTYSILGYSKKFGAAWSVFTQCKKCSFGPVPLLEIHPEWFKQQVMAAVENVS